MLEQPPDSLSREERINEIIAAFLAEVERGGSPNQEALIARHPDLAAELASFFADKEQFERFAQSLRPMVAARPAEATTLTDPGTAAPAPGTKLKYFGDYELLEEIGRGGMGVVYKARQVSLNRTVALKMILAGQLASAEDVQRFQHEAEAAAKLQHPHIVAIHEIGEHQGQHYFSMDYITGKSLAESLRDNPLPALQAAKYVQAVAEAIQVAHEHGILHRDLKPSNILIDRADRPHVTDFGLAKRLDGQPGVSGPAGLTATGQILGTPSYMPPEQAGGRPRELSPASDVYSLGAILYESVSGRPPFKAETVHDTIQQVLEAEPVPPRLLNPKVPRDLDTICLKCLEKDPAQRYATAKDLADDLGRFQLGEPIRAQPPTIPYQARVWFQQNLRAMLWATLFGLAGGLVAATAMCLICRVVVLSPTDKEWLLVIRQPILSLDPPWLWPVNLSALPWWLASALGLLLLVASSFAGSWAALVIRPANRAADIAVGVVISLIFCLTLFTFYVGPLVVFLTGVAPSWHELHVWSKLAEGAGAAQNPPVAQKLFADISARLPRAVGLGIVSVLALAWWGLWAGRVGGEFVRRGDRPLRDLLFGSGEPGKHLDDPVLMFLAIAWFLALSGIGIALLGGISGLSWRHTLLGVSCLVQCVIMRLYERDAGTHNRKRELVAVATLVSPLMYFVYQLQYGGEWLPVAVDLLVYGGSPALLYVSWRHWRAAHHT